MPQAPQSPHIAILGAGPTGLDAALEAARRGWSFRLYEAGDVPAANVRSWGHVRMFSPWSMNVSPRMQAALAATGRGAPGGDACPTGNELVGDLLDPLATSPAIAPHLATASRVVAIGREGLIKNEEIASPARAARPFRLLVRTPTGERLDHADAVIDASGILEHANSLGDGGIPAPGEAALEAAICRTLPDFTRDEAAWGGRRILLAGAGHSAQTAARDLAALAARLPGTQIVWVLRSPEPRFALDHDSLPERAALHREAAALVGGSSPHLRAKTGRVVEALASGGSGVVVVTLRGPAGEQETVEVDRILSLTGSVGDHRLYRQLQVHECYASGAPMKLAAALLGAGGGGDCTTQAGFGPDTLTNPEPRFFILGAKSYGRNSAFLMRLGWEQVDDTFALLERAFAG